MRKIRGVIVLTALIFLASPLRVSGATDVDILLNKLVDKGVLTAGEAKQISVETKEETRKELAKGTKDGVPEWVQRLKVKGDVRFRNQVDWGQGVIENRFRERVRLRLGIEAKINDMIYGGGRLVTAQNDNPTDARSTNITLSGSFQKKYVTFDQYYIRIEPTLKYVDKSKLWMGKFQNPFETTEMVWDSDICPEGMAIQYESPTLKYGFLPATTLYGNAAMLWVMEVSSTKADAMLWGWQAGLKSDLYQPWGTTLNLAATCYDFSHYQTKSPSESTSTNTRFTKSVNAAYIGGIRYPFIDVGVIARLDNQRIFNIEVPHGLYGEVMTNTAIKSGTGGKMAATAGAYVGNKSLKDVGNWKYYAELRYIGRDSIPDILPDSDFYGFTTTGTSVGGGTNGRGCVTGLSYLIFKNTELGLRYYWSQPIKTTMSKKPHSLAMGDILVKF